MRLNLMKPRSREGFFKPQTSDKGRRLLTEKYPKKANQGDHRRCWRANREEIVDYAYQQPCGERHEISFHRRVRHCEMR
jgi:hypothetical protein